MLYGRWIDARDWLGLDRSRDSRRAPLEHLDGDGARFFELVCKQDLEGIICKPKTSPYPFTWVKVKNPNYSQAEGRREMFNRRLSERSAKQARN